ncbi:hypothetical protein IK146_02270 [Candidatus Saccharibacteria bacterium]|nr:hypothetical protein [Candidatus Saccharibacteria bacterium]
MSERTERTGYSFQCRACGDMHILESSCKPHDGILVPCAFDDRELKEYNLHDFQPWRGVASLFTLFVREKK